VIISLAKKDLLEMCAEERQAHPFNKHYLNKSEKQIELKLVCRIEENPQCLRICSK
jgi:hypothetical protein